ncbi:MAG: hypothetical protein IPM48_07285 [Saprospiraceae bacterium]|nr:hypothetical protein [Saprospiraceae bacterium]
MPQILNIHSVYIAFTIFFTFPFNTYSKTNSLQSTYEVTKLSVFFKTTDLYSSKEQILESFKKNQFEDLPNSKLSFWSKNEAYWFILKIPPHFLEGNYYLHFDNRTLHSLKIFLLNDSLQFVKEYNEVGDQFSYDKRLIPDPDFTFPVQLNRSVKYIFFKIYNPYRKIVSTSIHLFPENYYIKLITSKQVFVGLIIGIWLLALLITCLIILNSRNLKYLVFVLHFMTLIIYQLSKTGIGYQYIWSDYPLLNIYTNYFILVSSSLYIYFIYVFFLMDTIRSKLLKYLFNINILISLLFMSIVIYHSIVRMDNYYILSILLYSTLLFFIVLFSITLFRYLYIKRTTLSFLLVIANMFSIIAGIIVALNGMNVVLRSFGNDRLLLYLFTTDLLVLVLYMTLQTKSKYKELMNQKLLISELKLEQQENILNKELLLKEERSRIASEMHDDLGSGLTTIKYLTDQVLDTVDHQEKSLIQRISEQSITLIHNLGEIIWAMNGSQDSLDNMLSYTRRYLSQNCDEFGIQLSWVRPVTEAEGISISGERRRHFFLVVKEAFHNIVKHANATQVTVDFNIHDGVVHFEIFDNGVGFDRDKGLNSGNGLYNMEKRMERLNGQLSIVSLVNGTKLSLTFSPNSP